MLSISRRFRLKDFRLGLPADAPGLDIRFHEPFGESGEFVQPGPEGPSFIRIAVFRSESSPGEPNGTNQDPILEASIETAPPAPILSFFQSVLDGRFPEGVPDTPEVRHFFGDIKPGEPLTRSHDVSDYWMPPLVSSYTERQHARVLDYARRTAELFRWIIAEHEIDGRIYSPALSVPMWSLNGSPYSAIVPRMQLTIATLPPPTVPSQAALEILRKLGQIGRAAPVSDDIIREAFALRSSDPRAAVVLAVAAAEAAFRRLVADLVPNAEYLVQELQTPPLVTLLKHYLPKLPVRSAPRLVHIPKKTLTALEHAVNLRNAIVHKGATEPGEDATRAALRVASNLVRLFDYYSGETWALEFVDEELRTELALRAM